MTKIATVQVEFELLEGQIHYVVAECFPAPFSKGESFSMQPTHGESSMSEMKLKVSEKGGVSLYGLGRFPVTLYKGQWEKLLGEVDNIRKFLEENADKLAVKE
jgi:hypothetical protein